MLTYRFPQRHLAPSVSSSPDQAVAEEGAGAWLARCAGCSAHSDAGEVDAAWRWVGEHVCGIETIRLDWAPHH